MHSDSLFKYVIVDRLRMRPLGVDVVFIDVWFSQTIKVKKCRKSYGYLPAFFPVSTSLKPHNTHSDRPGPVNLHNASIYKS